MELSGGVDILLGGSSMYPSSSNNYIIKSNQASTRYIDAKEPIHVELLFLSPIRSRKGAYPPKTRHGERRYFRSGPILYYLRCK